MRSSAIVIQDRDYDVMRGLLESRTMTRTHAAAIFFDGSYEAAKQRLRMLKAANLIGERERLVNAPGILFLTSKGYRVLRERGIHLEYPALGVESFARRATGSRYNIEHELEVMDVKAAFHDAFRGTEVTIDEFSTWPRMFEFLAKRRGQGGMETPVRPDGFIRLAGQGFAATFFLEVDRSTEVQERVVTQALCYREYYASGDFAVRMGGRREDFARYPFRVLLVMKNVDRRNNTAERLLRANPPILTQVCLTTMRDVIESPRAQIWIQPRGYREAVMGSSFEISENNRPIYHPQPERNRFVEPRIAKFAILEA
jgi:hypothetical protein